MLDERATRSGVERIRVGRERHRRQEAPADAAGGARAPAEGLPPVLAEILATGQVIDAAGGAHACHSGLSPREGDFLVRLIRENGIERTIETGCGFGISSLYLCHALTRSARPRHVMIDPDESGDEWCGIGVENLCRAGYDFAELIEERSEIALPRLLERGERFQLALVDGWHSFDHVLLDVFYLDRLLEVGGILVLDDVQFPSVGRAVRCITRYPHLELAGAVASDDAPSRRLHRAVSGSLSRVVRLLPRRLARRLFVDNLFRPNAALGVDGTTMVALRKTAEDARAWDWYEPF